MDAYAIRSAENAARGQSTDTLPWQRQGCATLRYGDILFFERHANYWVSWRVSTAVIRGFYLPSLAADFAAELVAEYGHS